MTTRVSGNTKLDSPKYTVVQHSGYGGAGKAEFRQGLESAQISTYAQLRAVEEVGGKIFDSYDQAEAFAETEQYPPGYTSMVPNAPGMFDANAKLDGRAVYLPVVTTYRLTIATMDGVVIDIMEIDAEPGKTNVETGKRVLAAATEMTT
jgi:hypothetical protein